MEHNEGKLQNREFDFGDTITQDNWQWDSDASRQQFKDLRIRADAAKNNAKFVIGAIVIQKSSHFSFLCRAEKASADNKSLSTIDNLTISGIHDKYR